MMRFRLILGHILDWYGYVFCEATFRVGDWMDKHYKYDNKKDRYEGFMGLVFEYMWKTIYKLGCWFYNRADKLCWSQLPDEMNPWFKADFDGKETLLKKQFKDEY